MRRMRWTHLIGLAGVLAAGGCGEPGGSAMVRVDGSSTVYPINEAVAEDIQREQRDIKVTVGISGTGGGFKKLCAGELDICAASRPIKPSEVKACAASGIGYIELPVAYDGIAIVVSRQNSWADHLTITELKLLWEPEAQRRVKRWSDVRPGWPDEEIHLFGAGVDSGTYDYFTQAIVGREHASRGDYTSSEDDNVLVTGVAGDRLAMGFLGYAYYEQNRARLKLLPVDDGRPENGAGPIAPSPETIKNGAYQPLSRPLFLYVGSRSLDRPAVDRFVRFYLSRASALAAEVGFIPLPDRAYPLAQTRVDRRVTGSMFGGGGSQVGVSIERLLEKELAQAE